MNHILEQLKQSPQKKIIIIGDIMLDEYIFGSVARISPEAPVPIVEEHHKEWSLGGAANVALNCKHIGCDVTLIGVTGRDDSSGIRLRGMLEKNSIALSGIVQSSTRSTTCKIRIMAQNHQLIRIDKEDRKSLDVQERAQVLEQFKHSLESHSVIVVSDYAKGVIDQKLMNEIIEQAQKFNSLVLVDPKGPCFLKYKGADYIKPNLKEFKEMEAYFNLDSTHSFKNNSRAICKILNLKGLIVTLGEQGIRYISQDSYIELPAIKREVFDLTGAGDTVIAFLSLGILNKMPMETCLHLANRAASVAISHLKTYAVSLQEIVVK